MKVITAPEIYIKRKDEIVCFLAGGIPDCRNWQEEVISILKEMQANGAYMEKLVIMNPRIPNFPIYDSAAAQRRIQWEFYNLELCDIFSMYFCNSESDQPICMYELGRNVLNVELNYYPTHTNRLVVSVEDGYKRQQDVNIQMQLALGGEDIVINGANPRIHAAAILSRYTWLEENK